MLKTRVASEVEQAAVAWALAQPAWGQERIANELHRRGMSVWAAAVRAVWQRPDLETISKRLQALAAQSAPGGWVLTAAQVRALAKAQADKEAHGELESAGPGYCGAQDRFYVGPLTGVGGIDQQTFLDTDTKLAFAKLSDRQPPLVAAELLNDRLMPFFKEHEVRLQPVLTERGTEYCGAPERHEDEL